MIRYTFCVFCLPALCVNGAERLLEKGEALLGMMVSCMDSSNSDSVRMEAFKLARCFAVSFLGSILSGDVGFSVS